MLLARAHFGELLGGGKAQICLPGAQHLARVTQIDRRPLRLAVRPVLAAANPLVGNDPKVGEGTIELFMCARHFPRLVGVLDSHEVAATGLVRDRAVDHRRVDAAEVNEAGRRRGQPGHLSTVRQVTGWIALFPHARFGQIGGKEVVDLVRLQHSGEGSYRDGLPGRC